MKVEGYGTGGGVHQWGSVGDRKNHRWVGREIRNNCPNDGKMLAT